MPLTLREHGVPCRDIILECEPVTTGTVKFFNPTKGFGFIAPDDGGKDVFVHVSAVERAGLEPLNQGQKVSFEVQADKRGPKAINLRPM